jgi:UDP-glucose 4-epimerase
VDDLASAHLAAADALSTSRLKGFNAFNLGLGKGFSVLDVVESCRRVTGAHIQFKKGPKRAGDPDQLVADASLARHELGWSPRFTNLDAIVETAWRWFSKHD